MTADPLAAVTIVEACAEFMRDRKAGVSICVVVDYREVMKLLLNAFRGRMLDTITTPELEAVMSTSWHETSLGERERAILRAGSARGRALTAAANAFASRM